MRPVVLIAGNFLREQRWFVLVLLVWVFGSAALFGLDERLSRDDALFFLRQQAAYAVALPVLIAAGAIHQERRSRRILAVLSKAVERGQYLAGLLLGSASLGVIAAVSVCIAGWWMAARVHWPGAHLPAYALLLMAAAALVASLAIFFSTFLHPLLAASATVIAVAAQLGLEGASGVEALPATALVHALFGFQFQPEWHAPSTAAGLALGEALLLWLAATAVFERRDVSMAAE